MKERASEARRPADWLTRAARELDPSTDDPAYWVRFRETVVGRAQSRLALRRAARPLTLSEIMSSWARTLLPAAAVTAVVGGLLIARPPDGGYEVTGQTEPNGAVVDVEELLLIGLEGETIPGMLDPGAAEPTVAFASDVF